MVVIMDDGSIYSLRCKVVVLKSDLENERKCDKCRYNASVIHYTYSEVE